jgi:hypothetical protein
VGEKSAGEIDGSEEVDLEDCLEILRRLILYGANDRVPGVVDEVVDLAAVDEARR